MVLHRKFLNFGKKLVKIGKIVSRWVLKSLKEEQIFRKPRIITNTDIHVLYHLCFPKMYATIGNNTWFRKKKIILHFFFSKFSTFSDFRPYLAIFGHNWDYVITAHLLKIAKFCLDIWL